MTTPQTALILTAILAARLACSGDDSPYQVPTRQLLEIARTNMLGSVFVSWTNPPDTKYVQLFWHREFSYFTNNKVLEWQPWEDMTIRNLPTTNIEVFRDSTGELVARSLPKMEMKFTTRYDFRWLLTNIQRGFEYTLWARWINASNQPTPVRGFSVDDIYPVLPRWSESNGVLTFRLLPPLTTNEWHKPWLERLDKD